MGVMNQVVSPFVGLLLPSDPPPLAALCRAGHAAGSRCHPSFGMQAANRKRPGWAGWRSWRPRPRWPTAGAVIYTAVRHQRARTRSCTQFRHPWLLVVRLDRHLGQSSTL